MTIYYTVYRTINLINGKEYIGMHSTDNIYDSYLGSGRNLIKSIHKYGRENFKKEILFIFDNPEDMIAKETELVNEEYVKREDTYNLMCGGRGGVPCILEEMRIKWLGKNNPMYGKKHSPEVLARISESLKGRIYSEETKRKLSISKIGENNPMYGKSGELSPTFGKECSIETRRKISESLKLGNYTGENSAWYGKHHTEETKALLREKLTGRKHTPETIKLMSDIKKGKKFSEETKQKIKESKKNISEETRKKLSDAAKGKKQRILECPHCAKSGGYANMLRWHFDNCKHKVNLETEKDGQLF